MNTDGHPALAAFLAQLGERGVFGQAAIQRQGSGFELRHVADAGAPVESLRETPLAALRRLAQFTEAGEFRPLKSAPTLARGWRAGLGDAQGLERALRELYPGALADWFAARAIAQPVTSFQAFVNRQTGMYRVAQALDAARAAAVVRAACAPRFCLKRRLWGVTGAEAEPAAGKSVIPCLEPCALLLEFARRTGRMDQAAPITLRLAPDEIATLAAALETALAQSGAPRREADFSAPANPRRLQMLLDRLQPLAAAPAPESPE